MSVEQANLLTLISLSAAPLAASALRSMLAEVEDTPCQSFWDRVSSQDTPHHVTWTLYYEDSEYVLIQAPDDSLTAILLNDVTGAFWRETLGIQLNEAEEETPVSYVRVAAEIENEEEEE